MIKITCDFCGTVWNDYPSNNRKYCSRKCYEEGSKRDTHKRNAFVCPQCGITFADRFRKNRKFCSYKCKSENQIGKTKSEETINNIRKSLIENGITHIEPLYEDKKGFIKITGTSKGYHTIIAENVLGRELKSNEVVHHIDGDRSNNLNNNLVICERSLHPTIHYKMKQRGRQQ